MHHMSGIITAAHLLVPYHNAIIHLKEKYAWLGFAEAKESMVNKWLFLIM